jgi:hypothetical protein
MYVSTSMSSLFEYEREGYPCRVNGGFIGSSAAWPYMKNVRVLHKPSELFDASTIVTTSIHIGTL